MKPILFVGVAAMLLGLIGCPRPYPHPVPAPCTTDAGIVVEDAGDDMTASLVRVACTRLASAGCEEGTDVNCSGTWAKAIRSHALPPSGPVCVTEAPDVPGIRTCGIRCRNVK